eukprot:TRINITY_DN15516_c0_g1_i1.p1 TRINITY_DN15516_c0_g1~~TRINITY_DN15516_c0_g1_i1.p1  ORF type:complete len:215 (+),score=35.92 TRINITY_DN15516_c0_g1_i1:113-757(+)
MVGLSRVIAFLSLVFLATYDCQQVAGIMITVHRQECLTEEVKYQGDAVVGSFVVYDMEDESWSGPPPGMDFYITGPDGHRAWSSMHKMEDKFSFLAGKAGLYRFCFNNHAHVPESVVFDVHVGHVTGPEDVAKEEKLSPLTVKLDKIREAVYSISADQHYLRARQLRHKKTMESTRRRVIWYAMLEAATLIGASLLQVYVLRRLFEKRIGYNRV